MSKVQIGWLDIVNKALNIAKAKVFSAIQKMEDPEAEFDVAFEEYKKAVQVLRRTLVLVVARKNWVVTEKEDKTNQILETENKVKRYLKQGQESRARIWSRNIALYRQKLTTLDELETLLTERMEVLEEEVVKAEAAQEVIEFTAEIEKVRIQVAQDLGATYKTLTGLTETTSVYESLEGLKSMREVEEAETDALMMLVNQGVLSTPAEKIYAPVEHNTEDIMNQLEQEILAAETATGDNR